MANLSTAQSVEVLFEKALETYEHQMQLLGLVDLFTPDPAAYQNSSNVIWRPVQQHAPIKRGWDLSNKFGDVIEEYYPATLEMPSNDAFQLRADDLRDTLFWERRGIQSGMRQATFLNREIANLVATQGSLFYRSNTDNGYNFVGNAQTLLNERQVSSDMRCYVLNERDRQVYAADLAERQTLDKRPEGAYSTGMIGLNVADFDVYSGSYLPTLAGGVSPDTTVTGDQSFEPEGVTTVGAATVNVDYRVANIPVAASASYNVGDRVTFTNTTGTPLGAVRAVGLADKTDTGQAMTFVITAKPSATMISVYPKPIAVDDSSLTAEQAAPANVNTTIKSEATVTRINVDASARANIFWAKDSIEVIGGDAPIELLAEFGGQQVISKQMSNGQKMYCAFDGDIQTLNFRARIFTWWGLVNKNPMANGVGIRF